MTKWLFLAKEWAIGHKMAAFPGPTRARLFNHLIDSVSQLTNTGVVIIKERTLVQEQS
jgi:hypothetical protein